MTVCVIIPALRPEGTIGVLQRVRGDCDAAIVIDNAGGAVGRAVEEHAPWATVLHPDRNVGFGAAIDLAARASDADVLVLVNDDVEPRPGFVAEITRPFSDDNVHQVACCLVVAGSTRIDSVGLSFDRTLRADNVHAFESDRPGQSVIGPSGAAAAYRRRTYLEVGGFAPELFAYWEDSDLALRLWAAGHDCAFAPKAVADHARGTALQGRSARQRELDAYGRGFVLGRYRGWLRTADRMLVPVVDWPSLVRGCLATRSTTPVRARRAGIRAGRGAPAVQHPGLVLRTRPIRATLAGQFRTVFRGPREVVPDDDRVQAAITSDDVPSLDR